MKLSIIIVSYNEEKYIAEAIDSCLKQDIDFDYEIIVGDDGSSDNSLKIIQDYEEKYPNVIKHFVMERKDLENLIPSIRVSNIIKKALTIAKGEYVTLLSADDYFEHNKFKLQVKFLDENKNYMSCYTNYHKVWDDGRDSKLEFKKNIPRSLFWARAYMHISCFVFRKECEKNILNNFCDDTGLIYSIFFSGKTKYFNEVTFAYRQRNASIMHEADTLELSLLELLLYNDILKFNKYKISSLVRFLPPLKCILKSRELLSQEKYKKYLIKIERENNFLKELIIYNELNLIKKIKIRFILVFGELCKFIVRVLYKLINVY